MPAVKTKAGTRKPERGASLRCSPLFAFVRSWKFCSSCGQGIDGGESDKTGLEDFRPGVVGKRFHAGDCAGFRGKNKASREREASGM